VHHDNTEREYAYDNASERTLQMTPDLGWTMVRIKDDWKTGFAWH
jgi:hypothetical protein